MSEPQYELHISLLGALHGACASMLDDMGEPLDLEVIGTFDPYYAVPKEHIEMIKSIVGQLEDYYEQRSATRRSYLIDNGELYRPT